MSRKKFSVDFFQMRPPNTGISGLNIHGLQEHLDRLATIQYQMQGIGNYNVIFDNVKKNEDGFIVGAGMRVLMQGIPPSYDTNNKQIKPLGLNEYEGLLDATCFLIDTSMNILVKDKNGLSTSSLSKYIKESLNLPASPDCAIVINPSEIERFYSMSKYFKFKAKLAHITNGTLFAEGKNKIPTRQLVSAADNTNTDYLTIGMDISGKNKKQGFSLLRDTLVGMINQLILYKDTEEVKELQVSGLDDQNQFVLIDLISERLQDSYEIEFSERIMQDLKIEKRIDNLIDIYKRHKPSLLNAYAIKARNT